jgi:hypothetical protein
MKKCAKTDDTIARTKSIRRNEMNGNPVKERNTHKAFDNRTETQAVQGKSEKSRTDNARTMMP